MCEILVRAFSSQMKSVAEERAYIDANRAEWEKYVADHADCPKVEADYKRVTDYVEAKSILTGKTADSLKVEDRAALETKVAEYEAAPLSVAEVEKVRLYYDEPLGDTGARVSSTIARWKYRKHQLEVQYHRDDAEWAAAIAEKDRRGCYKTGDPVVVKPDGWGWGREECPPKFIVLKVPELSVEDGRQYVVSETQTVVDPEMGEREEVTRRRRYGIDISGLEHGAVLKRGDFNKRVTDKTKVG